jgi:hypothetical protein
MISIKIKKATIVIYIRVTVRMSPGTRSICWNSSSTVVNWITGSSAGAGAGAGAIGDGFVFGVDVDVG